MHRVLAHRPRRLLAATTIVLAFVAAPVAPSGAAPEPVTFIASGGQITFAGQSVAIPPGGLLSGEWDAATGAFNGSLGVGVLNLPVDASIANLGIINLTFDVRPGPVTGTIPADGSPGTLSSDFTVVISGTVPLEFNCTLGPVSFNLATTLSGDNITASEAGFTVPVLAVTETCGVASVASGLLGLPSTDSSAELTFTRAAAGTAAPVQVTGQPLFTG